MRRHLLLAVAGVISLIGAALAFDRVFVDDAWRAPTMLALLLAVGLAAVLHALRVPAFVGALLSALGLFVTSYILFIDGGPLIPGFEQVRDLAVLGRDGIALISEQLAPVNAVDGFVFLLFAGTWVVAHATHEVIVRSSVGAIGLALPASLWIVAVSIPVPDASVASHTVPFLVGAVVYLLATADHDVAGWASDRVGPRMSGLGASVGLAAIVLATAIPLTIFGYGAEAIVEFRGGSSPRGYQPIVDVGDRLKLPTPRDVLLVRTGVPSYLRIAALETFDGTSWRIGPASEGSFRPRSGDLFTATDQLPPEVPITGSHRDYSVDVAVLELENIYVPVPYQPVTVSGAAADDMVYSRVGGFVATADLTNTEPEADLTVGVTPGVQYTVEATTPLPSYDELLDTTWTDDDLAGNVELPTGYPALAEQAQAVWTEVGATTTIDRVLALQDWFIGPDSAFQYSTDVPDLRGADALHRFVLDTQIGYCEYFATAMAVMLRTADIPTRVSVGFLPGTIVDEPANGVATWAVSTSDAHAWVEVLFPGVGWVRFDPTPRADGATYVPTITNLNPSLSQAELGAEPDAEPTDAATSDPGEATGGPTAAPTDDRNIPEGLDALPNTAAGGTPFWALALTGILLAAIAIIVYARWSERRPNAHDPIGRVLVAQGRVHDEARRLGMGRQATETVHETAARLATDGRASPERLWRLAHLSAEAAFGRRADEDSAREAEQLSATTITELHRSARPRDRAVAPVRAPLELVRRWWLLATSAVWRAWEALRKA